MADQVHQPGQGPLQRFSRRVRAAPGLLAGAPRWVLVIVGLACLALGLSLIVRPLAAITTLGIYVGVSSVISGGSNLLRRGESSGILTLAEGLVWIAVGAALLIWRGPSIQLLIVAIAGLLIVDGALRIVRGFRSRDLLSGVFGFAEIAWGVLALSWPDITLLVVAVLFGFRTAAFGIAQMARALFRTSATDDHPRRESRRWVRATTAVAAAVSLVAAGGAAYISLQFRNSAPVIDSFYATPDVVPASPGVLIRSETYHGNLPEGVRAHRIFYSTTATDGSPALASAVVAVPAQQDSPAPVIAWAHGTVGVARACAPSIGPDAISPAGIPALDEVVAHGWAVVSSDYTGMGAEGDFPYLVGTGEAYSVLDALRAARDLDAVQLAEDTVIWGHSQGGHAALWAGQVAATYAPELRILGTASLSPASDPQRMAIGVAARQNGPEALLATAFVADAYSRNYDGLPLEQIVAPAALPLVREAASRCTSDLSTLVTVLSGLAISMDQPILRQDPASGPMAERLAQNKALGPWDAPVFLGHGTEDEVIPVAHSRDYLEILCQQAPAVTARFYEGKTHMSVLAPESDLPADLSEWTSARFAGEPAVSDSC